MRGLDPVAAGMLTRERDPARPRPTRRTGCSWRSSVAADVKPPKRKEPRYTPLSASARTGRTRSPGCCATIPS